MSASTSKYVRDGDVNREIVVAFSAIAGWTSIAFSNLVISAVNIVGYEPTMKNVATHNATAKQSRTECYGLTAKTKA